MKKFKYIIEYFLISVLFVIFKILGYKNSSNLGEKIGSLFGPLFRNKKIILNNLRDSKVGSNDTERNKIIKSMWGNYGRILAEYPFIKYFRDSKLQKYISINGQDVLDELKIKKKKSNICIRPF